MPAPFNYGALQQLPNPGESLLQGLQVGSGIAQAQFARQDQALKLQQLQSQVQQQQQYRTDVADAISNPDPNKTLALILKYPDRHEAIKKAYDAQHAEKQQQDVTDTTSIYAALQQNRPDAALGILQRQRDALANSGKPTDQIDQQIDLVKNDPQRAQGVALFALGHMVPLDQLKAITSAPYAGNTAAAEATKAQAGASEAVSKATTAGVEAQNAPTAAGLGNQQKRAEIANLNSQIKNRAQQFGLDQQKLATETQLKLAELGMKSGPQSPAAQNLINDAVTDAVANTTGAQNTLELAARFAKANGASGLFGSAASAFRSAVGDQSDYDLLRKQYDLLVGQQVIKLLPPGSASDKDIAFAREGFLPNNANSEQISSFLRGVAKLQVASSVASNARAEWVGATGGLGKAKSDIEVDGVKVPAGTTFPQFTQNYLAAKTKDKLLELSAPSLIQNAKRAPDGKLYAPDPNRPGKYLLIQE